MSSYEKKEDELSRKLVTSVKTIQMLVENEAINEELQLVINGNKTEIKDLKHENTELQQELLTLKRYNSCQIYTFKSFLNAFKSFLKNF